MTRRLQRFLALVLLVSPSTLFALGLGDIQLHSGLNEPLDADIELVSAAPDELSSLRAALASRETFARYGLERPASLQSLEFRVTRSGDGRNVLKTIHDEYPDARTVLITGAVQEVKGEMADAVCFKPFDTRLLLDTIERFAKRKQGG